MLFHKVAAGSLLILVLSIHVGSLYAFGIVLNRYFLPLSNRSLIKAVSESNGSFLFPELDFGRDVWYLDLLRVLKLSLQLRRVNKCCLR